MICRCITVDFGSLLWLHAVRSFQNDWCSVCIRVEIAVKQMRKKEITAAQQFPNARNRVEVCFGNVGICLLGNSLQWATSRSKLSFCPQALHTALCLQTITLRGFGLQDKSWDIPQEMTETRLSGVMATGEVQHAGQSTDLLYSRPTVPALRSFYILLFNANL